MAETLSFDLDETKTMFRDLSPHWDQKTLTEKEMENDHAVEREDHQDDQRSDPTAEDQYPNKPRQQQEPTTTEEAVESQACLVVKKKQLLEELEAMIMAGKESIPENCGLDEAGNGGVAEDEEEMKVKPSRRRAKGRRKVLETQNVDLIMAEAQCGDGTKKTYSREVMEVLRFVKMGEQRKMWKNLLNGLDPLVRKEYNTLASSKHHKNVAKKDESPAILRETCSKAVENGLANLVKSETDDASPLDVACSNVVGDEDNYPDVEGEYSEDDDSDEGYASIQRPAFVVQGEPNFDSGPPEDGLEYLRRVRWEAAQIPKVRVAKLDRSKLRKEQSDYMPKIPEIAKCPEHLLPTKQWEDEFLAEFSQLRLALSRLDISRDLLSESCAQHLSGGITPESSEKGKTIVHADQFGDRFGSENADDLLSNLSTDEDNSISSEPEKLTPKSFVNENGSDYPLLSMILKMESVARVSMLKKRISSFGGMNTLLRSDCLWLFALCAVVDTPLDADTSSSLRSLLRKCADLLAGKSETDDEVVMLNILATVSGRYFGQLET